MPMMEISAGYFTCNLFSKVSATALCAVDSLLTNGVCYETKIGNKINRSSPLPTPLLEEERRRQMQGATP
jgi:hypothetical protein